MGHFIRLSVPQLPHGAQPSLPHNPLRVTVLPWYIAVSANMVDLEIPSAGIYAMLYESNRI